MDNWFETVFVVMISLAVVHYAFVFYTTLIGKLFGLLYRLGRLLFGRRGGRTIADRYLG